MRIATVFAAATLAAVLTACTPTSDGVEAGLVMAPATTEEQAPTPEPGPEETTTAQVTPETEAEVAEETTTPESEPEVIEAPQASGDALEALYALPVVSHDVAPYDRDDFGGRWVDFDGTGCTTRQDILRRDATEWVGDGCQPEALVIQDVYTGSAFVALSAGDIDIDHVVSIHDAWLTGAQGWDDHSRVAFYQDPLNLLATEGSVNRAKSNLNAAQWLPPYEAGHCDFAARQVAVKTKWGLGVTDAEQDALAGVLAGCSGQGLPTGGEGTPVFDATPYLTGQNTPAPVNPAPSIEPQPEPGAGASDGGGEVYYANCTEVRAAGAAPILLGEPGFRPAFDRDGDGVGCE